MESKIENIHRELRNKVLNDIKFKVPVSFIYNYDILPKESKEIVLKTIEKKVNEALKLALKVNYLDKIELFDGMLIFGEFNTIDDFLDHYNKNKRYIEMEVSDINFDFETDFTYQDLDKRVSNENLVKDSKQLADILSEQLQKQITTSSKEIMKGLKLKSQKRTSPTKKKRAKCIKDDKNLTIPELKELAKSNGLPVSGNKKTLCDRLKNKGINVKSH